jgi:hypothetical protein
MNKYQFKHTKLKENFNVLEELIIRRERDRSQRLVSIFIALFFFERNSRTFIDELKTQMGIQ